MLILVLDDEPSIAQAMRMILEADGYRVMTASSCDEALGVITEYAPQLVLSDVCMPYRNGFTFIREVREAGFLQQTPVIFVSALTQPADIEAGLQAGAADYITKPFAPKRLLESVRTHMPAL